MDFGTILRRAWEIIWNHKVLWIFGILASCGSGGSGGSGGGGGNISFNTTTASDDIPGFIRDLTYFFERQSPENLFLIAAGIILLALILGLVFFLLGILGRVALIKGAHQAELGQRLGFRQLISDSMPYYLRGLGLNLLLGLIVFVVFVIFGLVAFGLSAVTFGLALICLIPLACLLIPLFKIGRAHV